MALFTVFSGAFYGVSLSPQQALLLRTALSNNLFSVQIFFIAKITPQSTNVKKADYYG
jgi:hypothetical protein